MSFGAGGTESFGVTSAFRGSTRRSAAQREREVTDEFAWLLARLRRRPPPFARGRHAALPGAFIQRQRRRRLPAREQACKHNSDAFPPRWAKLGRQGTGCRRRLRRGTAAAWAGSRQIPNISPRYPRARRSADFRHLSVFFRAPAQASRMSGVGHCSIAIWVAGWLAIACGGAQPSASTAHAAPSPVGRASLTSLDVSDNALAVAEGHRAIWQRDRQPRQRRFAQALRLGLASLKRSAKRTQRLEGARKVLRWWHLEVQ